MAFSAVLFGVRKSIYPVKWSDEVLVGYLSGVRWKSFAYGSANAIATMLFCVTLKSRIVYLPFCF